ncbi:hypothetical protein MKP08_08035 [Erythrobacter sp. LQ02-29]|uniref:hypothetical protein n=1 Tax=Erythrobacter sp. LQ02-29 TaxID=2920384 RepID=UPI001F4DEF88|nr:hypothetical protein [Erythrobacter sp. LQ02-29]MCP9222692.1 hypothetical protein [Erythrobacter sp. LQ02-29]
MGQDRLTGARAFASLIAGLAALLCAACGDEAHHSVDPASEEVQVQIPTREGRATMRSGPQVAPRLPLGFTIVPNARVVHATDVKRADRKGSLVALESGDSPVELARFYRQEAEAAGLAISYSLGDEGRQTLVGEGAKGRSFSLSARREGDLTRAELFVSDGLQR